MGRILAPITDVDGGSCWAPWYGAGLSAETPELREGDEDYPGRRVQLGSSDLDHRGVAVPQLDDTATGTRWRIVDPLGQLNPVEGSYPTDNGHSSPC
jgi:hypothetical protein